MTARKLTPELKQEIYDLFRKLKSEGIKNVRTAVMTRYGFKHHQQLYDVLGQVESGNHLTKTALQKRKERCEKLWNTKYINQFTKMGGMDAPTDKKVKLMRRMFEDDFPKSVIAKLMGYRDHTVVLYHLNK